MTSTESPELKVAKNTLKKLRRLSTALLQTKRSIYQTTSFIETVLTDCNFTLNEIERIEDKNTAKCTSKPALEGPKE